MAHLKPGDVVRLEKGMEVMHLALPAWLFNNQHPFSTKTSKGSIQLGRPRKRKSHEGDLRQEINRLIRFVFAYHELRLDPEILDRFLRHQIPSAEPNEFTAPAGEYVVCDTAVEMGDRIVYCQCLEDPDTKIYFFQASNWFSSYPDVNPIRRQEPEH